LTQRNFAKEATLSMVTIPITDEKGKEPCSGRRNMRPNDPEREKKKRGGDSLTKEL